MAVTVAINTVREALLSPLGLAAAIIVALFFLRRAALPKPFPGIPHNAESVNRVLGDLPLLISSASTRQWFPDQVIKHNSPIVQVFLSPFQKPWILVGDQYEGANLLTRRMKEFDRAKSTSQQFHGVVPSGLITLMSKDKQFKKNKEMMRDLMSPGFLDKVSAPHIYGTAERLVELWQRKADISKGRPFEASADIHNATCDMITMAAFGIDVDETQLVKQLRLLAPANGSSLETVKGSIEPFEFEPVPLGEDMNAVTLVSDSIFVALKYPFPLVTHFLYRNLNSAMRHAMSASQRFVNKEIGNSIRRLEEDEPEWCALDQMLAREKTIASKEQRKPNYYAQYIKSEVLGYLIGGHDTTSATSRWGIKFLANAQEKQSKLRTALHEAFPDAVAEKRMPTVKEITAKHIPYLDAALNEMSRLARVFALVGRDAIVDTEIMGHHVPKGTFVGVLTTGPGQAMPSMDMDNAAEKRSDGGKMYAERLGTFNDDDINDFNPDRWIKRSEGADEFDANSGPFMPFGLGPRGCFGRKLARMKLSVMFTLILWNFELLPLPNELNDDKEKEGLTRAPETMYVRLARVKQ